MLDQMPAWDEPVTEGRPYLRQEGPGEYVIQGSAYLPVMDRIWATFAQAGFPYEGQYDYLSWCRRFLEEAKAEWFTPGLVATMSRDECFYLLRTIQRKERFCDGAWAAEYRGELFHALARRLIELDHASPTPAPLP
jgi:hypothetical protein